MPFFPQQVLITGGSDGIGLALASRFAAAGADVLVTGRNLEKLENAASAVPDLKTFAGDMGRAADREALAEHAKRQLPLLDIVINNAGIQRRIGLAEDGADWPERQAEIDILLAGPIHLNHLLIPHILAHAKPACIGNVTSGGAFIPQVFAPVYSAAKAGLHSYTVTLRHALAGTPCRVVEIIPPAVRTALGTTGHGAPLDDFADHVLAGLADPSRAEIGFGPTESEAFLKAKAPWEALFEQSAARFPVRTYAGQP